MRPVDWSRFPRQYQQRETHWYVSKIKSYDLESLKQLREGLRLLNHWFVEYDALTSREGRQITNYLQPKSKAKIRGRDMVHLFRWTLATELFFAWLLDRNSVISQANRPAGIRERYEAILAVMDEGKPYRYLKTRFGEKLLNDLAANARNFLSMYKKLGLAWMQTGQTVSITSTGERFANASSDEELRAIFERQVLKWQLGNPTLPSRYRDLRIFPFTFLLQVLLQIKPAQLSKTEYALFVTKAQSMDEVDDVVAQVNAWRALTDAQRESIVAKLSQSQTTRRRSLYLELLDSANKEIEFFALTSPLRRTVIDGTMGIELADRKRAQQIVRLRGREPVFIEFKNELDWFSYFGDWETGPTIADAIEYYAQIGDIEKAEAVAKQPEATREEKSRLRQAIQERHLEDYFSEHLDLLEKGLRLYHKGDVTGRQYKTPINRIDNLCLDRRDQFVVVEYKKRKSSDETVGQTLRYIGWIHVNLADGKRVRGIIVADKIDEKTKYAIKGMQLPRGQELIVLIEHSFTLKPVEL